MNKVTMTHPHLDAVIEVAESAVPFHMASGWMPVDDTAAKVEKDNVPADIVESEEAVKPARKRTASEES